MALMLPSELGPVPRFGRAAWEAAASSPVRGARSVGSDTISKHRHDRGDPTSRAVARGPYRLVQWRQTSPCNQFTIDDVLIASPRN